MTRVLFTVPEAMNEALHDCATSEGRAISAVVRQALEHYLTQRNYAVSGRVTAGGDRRKPATTKTTSTKAAVGRKSATAVTTDTDDNDGVRYEPVTE